jgi:hypothetical protein
VYRLAKEEYCHIILKHKRSAAQIWLQFMLDHENGSCISGSWEKPTGHSSMSLVQIRHGSHSPKWREFESYLGYALMPKLDAVHVN